MIKLCLYFDAKFLELMFFYHLGFFVLFYFIFYLKFWLIQITSIKIFNNFEKIIKFKIVILFLAFFLINFFV